MAADRRWRDVRLRSQLVNALAGFNRATKQAHVVVNGIDAQVGSGTHFGQPAIAVLDKDVLQQSL